MAPLNSLFFRLTFPLFRDSGVMLSIGYILNCSIITVLSTTGKEFSTGTVLCFSSNYKTNECCQRSWETRKNLFYILLNILARVRNISLYLECITIHKRVWNNSMRKKWLNCNIYRNKIWLLTEIRFIICQQYWNGGNYNHKWIKRWNPHPYR